MTPISGLNADRVPVTIRATVRSALPSPQPSAVQVGLLRDESGEVPFVVWKDSGIKKLEAGKDYVFHRAGLGMRGGRLEVRVGTATRVIPVKKDQDLSRIFARLAREEKKHRKRLIAVGRGGTAAAPRAYHRSRKGLFSILISIGLFAWVLVMVVHYTGILTKGKLSGILERRKVAAEKKIASRPREGKVIEIVNEESLRVQMGEEAWLVHYLGLDIPFPPGDPLTVRALNYAKYLLSGKMVRLEFESWKAPEGNEAWAYVFVGDQLANAALLEQGLGRLSSTPEKMRYVKQLEAAQSSARAARRGLWSRAGK